MEKMKPLFGLSGERGGMEVVMRSKSGDQWVPPWGCRARARVRPPPGMFLETAKGEARKDASEPLKASCIGSD